MEEGEGTDRCQKEGTGLAYPHGGKRIETGSVVIVNNGIFKGEMMRFTSILVTIHVAVVAVCNNIQPCPLRTEDDSNIVVARSLTSIVAHR